MNNPNLIGKCTDVKAFYIFADICNFTGWSNKHTLFMCKLIDCLFDPAFGKCKNINVPIVKLTGDGFFAISKYQNEPEEFIKAFCESIQFIDCVNSNYKQNLKESKIPDNKEILLKFGISAGWSKEFQLAGFNKDYVSPNINLASRLCSLASTNNISIDNDIIKSIPTFNKGTYFQKISSTEVHGFKKVKYYKFSLNNLSQLINLNCKTKMTMD